MDGLSVFQYDVLATLNTYGDLHGLGIKRQLQTNYDRYEGMVNHGRLYPNLDRLEEAGYLSIDSRDKRTNEYGLTSAGREKLSTRIDELTTGELQAKAGALE